MACQSRTAGLHITLLVNGVNRKDIVIVSILTFKVAVNPVKDIGATPVFMEALGTYYRRTGSDRKYFAGTIGGIRVYSFNGNKIITTGGRGCLYQK